MKVFDFKDLIIILFAKMPSLNRMFFIAAIILVIYIVYMMKSNMEFIDYYGKTLTLAAKILCICSLNPALIYISFVVSSNLKTKEKKYILTELVFLINVLYAFTLALLQHSFIWGVLSFISNVPITLLTLRIADELNVIWGLGKTICPYCSAANEKGKKFCNECGNSLRQETKNQGNICPECGADLSEDALFCGECGYRLEAEEPVPEPVSDTVICPSCAAENTQGKKFCVKCGNKLL
ncbi:MAG: zinc ribbon domain-containing protein [Ruminococcus sp.]|nr:zinc ribbon domain-containing protein [Ruminococcus sp.]MCM1381840.1 zinc ribbon domain-containing protein [Muribaculaceae bacterium]MCM1478859.1 zinc ribbon domain-containing protein [Muribaculaceae bacterium]